MLPIILITGKRLKEINALQEEVVRLRAEAANASVFIENIENGQLDVTYQGIIEKEGITKGSLSGALLSMRNQLSTVAEKEKERNWATEGLAKFVEILRTNNENVEELYDSILANLVKYVGANQGGLFIVNEQNQDNYIELVACYAYERKKYIQKRLEAGEGLVGQAFVEADTIFITDIPDKYVRITSGLGESTPTSLLIVPLKLNGIVFGIIELASFQVFKPHQIEFLEKLGESIASTISTTQVAQRTRELLENSQVQTEQLRAAEEEMHQNMEELTSTQEELLRKQSEVNNFLEKFELVTKTTTEGLWDMTVPKSLEFKDDTPFNWADRFREMLGYSNEFDFPNILSSWSNLLHPEHKQKTLEAFSAHLLDVSGKTPYDVTYQLKLKNGTYRWFRAVGNTLRDEKGTPLRVAGSLIDIQSFKDIQVLKEELDIKVKERTNALGDALQKFELVTKTTTEGLWDMTVPKSLEFKDDTPFNWADRFREMLGYSNEFDFPNILSSWSNLLHPEHKQKTLEAFSAHLLDVSGKTPYDVTYQLKLKNDSYHWFRAVGNTLRDEKGTPLRVAGSLIDIQSFKDIQALKEELDIKVKERTVELEIVLNEAKVKNEELSAAEEEMRQNMEELEATQEEMGRKEVEMTGLFDSINNTLSTIEFHKDGKILNANNNFLSLMGYSMEEIKGLHHRIFIEKKYAESQDYIRFWDELNAGVPQTNDFMRVTKAGKQVWMRASYTPVRDVNGNIFKIIKLAQDITEKKLAEIESLRLSLVADNTDNSVIITDKNGLTEYINKGFERMTGYSLADLKGKKPGQLLQGPETDQATIKRIHKKLADEKPFYEEILNYAKDGKTYWISLNINPVFNEKGELDKFIAVQANITQIKLEALDLGSKLEAIDKSNGVIEFDTQGNVLTANDIFLNLMEYELPEITGKHHSLFMPSLEKDSEDYKAFWKKLGSGSGFISGEFRRVTKSGKEVWLKGNYNTVIDLAGRPHKVIKIAQNITEQKVLEAEIHHQTEELRAQEEELRQNMEEMQAIHEAMEKKQEEVEFIAHKYEQILEGCSDAVIMIDKIGIITFFNKIAEKMWGYDRNEVTGKNIKMLMKGDMASETDQYLANYHNDVQAQVIGKGQEVEALCKNGSFLPILLTLSKAVVNGESIYTAFIKDITLQREGEEERKQQMEEIRAQEEELRQNMEELQSTQEEMERQSLEMKGLIVALDSTLATIEFNMDGTVITANGNFLSLMGYTLSEVTGKHHRLFVDPDFAISKDYVRFWDNLKQGFPQLGEVKRISKSGKEIWLSASYTPVLDAHNHPVKVIKFAQNITEQKSKNLDFESQLKAINLSYAVVEFDIEGHIQ